MDSTRILIVDDEISIRKLLSKILENRGYLCFTAQDISEARTLLDTQEFALVLSDIRMPGESGIDLIRHIKEKYHDMAILMVTAVDDPEEAHLALKIGIHGYIIKPFNEAQILINVQNALKRRSLEIENRQHIEDLEEKISERTAELQHSEERYKGILKSIEEGYFELDARGHLTFFNDSLCKISGYRRDELKGVDVSQFTDPETSKIGYRIFNQVFTTQKAVDEFVWEMTRKDGTTRQVGASISSIMDAEGKTRGFRGIIRDVTERVRAFQRIKDSETRLKAIMDSVQVGIVIMDPETRQIMEVNRQAATMIGATQEQIIGTACHQYLCEAEEGRCPLADQALEMENEESTLLRADQSRVPILKTATWCEIDGRRYIMASFSDLTNYEKARNDLEESEERFRTISDSAQDAIVTVNRGGMISYWNRSAEKIFGYTEEEAIGENFHKLLTPERFLKSHEKAFSKFQKTDIGQTLGNTLELTAVRKSGEEFPVELSMSSVKINGEWHGVGVLRDISKRKMIEEEMRKANSKLKGLVSGITSILIVISDSLTISQWNKVAERVFGIPSGDVLEKPFAECGIKWEWERIDQAMTVCRKNTETVRIDDVRFFYNDGKEGFLGITLNPISRDNGGRPAVLLMAADITERKQAKEKLRESRDQFYSLVSNIPGITYRCALDKGWTMLYMSTEIDRLSGYPASDFINNKVRTYESVIHPEDTDFVSRRVLDAVESGEPWEVEYRILHRDGSIRWAFEKGRGVSVQNEKVISLDGLILDITDRKQAEDERDKLQEQFLQAQKLESIGQLAAGIAHEINTPIQFVGDNTRFLQEAFSDMDRLISRHDQLLQAVKNSIPPDKLVQDVEDCMEEIEIDYLIEEIPRAIEQTLEGAGSVSKIVASMKDFSHPGTDEKTAVDINRALESTITVARNEWKYVADVETDFDTSLPLVPCLPGELNQVFLNMIINGAHAISDVAGRKDIGKGKIKVSSRHDADSVKICFSDSGCGIPEEIQHRIFDPFFTTKEVGKGTGQGLAISHSVINEKHGGSLTFETEPGKGTTFIIQLPLNGSAA